MSWADDSMLLAHNPGSPVRKKNNYKWQAFDKCSVEKIYSKFSYELRRTGPQEKGETRF